MQKHNQSEGETLNNHKETEETEFNDAVELGSLTTATYYQSHGRERQRRSRKPVNNLPRLTDTDTEGEEDELLLSPGKRRQRCCNMFSIICCRRKEFQSRTVWVGQECLQNSHQISSKIRNTT